MELTIMQSPHSFILPWRLKGSDFHHAILFAHDETDGIDLRASS